MAASPQAAFSAGNRQKRRRRRGRLVFDLLVLLAIVVIGAIGAFEAGVWVMPGSNASHAGQAPGAAPTGVGSGVMTSVASGAPGDSGAIAGQTAPAASDLPSSTTPGATLMSPHGTPWRAWKPSVAGSVEHLQLPAPWLGGTRTILVTVYLPGGYASSNRSYPVVYEAPFSYRSWEKWMGVKALLDAQMSSGAVPASIVVFAHPAGGPYVDTECANSADGRQSLETFYSSTLVQAIDARYRTIRTAAARSVMGFSQGGFCATMLALRHPDVFSTALSISGYYQAGIRAPETPSAWRPFAGNASLEASYSPLQLVGQLSSPRRASMLLVLEADAAQPFYGSQSAAMSTAAHQAGVAVLAVPMPIYHSWIVVKAVLPRMLRALASHEVALGVFG